MKDLIRAAKLRHYLLFPIFLLMSLLGGCSCDDWVKDFLKCVLGTISFYDKWKVYCRGDPYKISITSWPVQYDLGSPDPMVVEYSARFAVFKSGEYWQILLVGYQGDEEFWDFDESNVYVTTTQDSAEGGVENLSGVISFHPSDPYLKLGPHDLKLYLILVDDKKMVKGGKDSPIPHNTKAVSTQDASTTLIGELPSELQIENWAGLYQKSAIGQWIGEFYTHDIIVRVTEPDPNNPPNRRGKNGVSVTFTTDKGSFNQNTIERTKPVTTSDLPNVGASAPGFAMVKLYSLPSEVAQCQVKASIDNGNKYTRIIGNFIEDSEGSNLGADTHEKNSEGGEILGDGFPSPNHQRKTIKVEVDFHLEGFTKADLENALNDKVRNTTMATGGVTVEFVSKNTNPPKPYDDEIANMPDYDDDQQVRTLLKNTRQFRDAIHVIVGTRIGPPSDILGLTMEYFTKVSPPPLGFSYWWCQNRGSGPHEQEYLDSTGVFVYAANISPDRLPSWTIDRVLGAIISHELGHTLGYLNHTRGYTIKDVMYPIEYFTSGPIYWEWFRPENLDGEVPFAPKHGGSGGQPEPRWQAFNTRRVLGVQCIDVVGPPSWWDLYRNEVP